MMYRGQSREWPLLPSISRLGSILDGYENWQVLQDDLLNRFAKHGRPFLSPLPLSVEEWLLHAQHYGVPTRLLDWTTNPLKALFFAVESELHTKKDGVVWAFTPSYWRDDPMTETALDNNDLTPFYPKHINSRITAQESCFVAFPMPENSLPLCPMNLKKSRYKAVRSLGRIKIPAKSKPGLLRELHVLGVTYRTVFPDLQGVAQHILAELRGT
jgi:hypothetical protein